MEQTSLWNRENQRSLPLWLPAVAVALVVLRVGIAFVPEAPEIADAVRWVSIEHAEETAQREQKSILYDFSAAWCGPCRQMEKEVFADPKLAAEINQLFVPVKVIDRTVEDGSNQPDVEVLQRRHRIAAFPTIVVVGAGGTTSRMEGFGGRNSFEELIRRASTSRVR